MKRTITPNQLTSTEAGRAVIYDAALNHYGVKNQVSIASGECGELIVALAQRFIQNRGTNADVAVEIADVEIMCAQLRLVVGSGLVDAMKDFKLERLAGRIGLIK